MQFVTKARLAKRPLFLWMAPTLPHSPDRFRQYLTEWPTPCTRTRWPTSRRRTWFGFGLGLGLKFGLC
jgi:hypothetical protein